MSHGTIPALVAATADRLGDQLAVVDGDTRLTYAELAAEARTFGAALVAAGLWGLRRRDLHTT